MGNTVSTHRLDAAMNHSQSQDASASTDSNKQPPCHGNPQPQATRQPAQSHGLQASNQQLRHIPDSIIDLAKSRRAAFLDFSKNRLVELPDGLGELAELERLVAGDNLLVRLPDGLGGMGRLRFLDLTGNRLSVLPESTAMLQELWAVGLSECAFKQFPEVLCKLVNLRKIGFYNNAIDRLPASIGSLCLLEKLDLSGNNLTELPAEIGKLTRLTWLNVSHNRLTRLPDEIGQLPWLEELGASNNRLVALPDFSRCPKLHILAAFNNKLTSVGEQVVRLAGLTKLDVSNNEIECVDERVFALPALSFLNLKENPLKGISDDVRPGRMLARLDLTNCQLNHIPGALVNGSIELSLSGNPFFLDRMLPLKMDNLHVPSLLSHAKRELMTTMGPKAALTPAVCHIMEEMARTCRQCHVCARPFDWTPRVIGESRVHTDNETRFVVSFQVCSGDCKRHHFRPLIISQFNSTERHRQIVLVDGEPVIVRRR